MMADTIVEVPEDLQDLIPDFLENRKTDLLHLQTTLEAQDFTELSKMGHKLKGTCGGYGFHVLGELGKELEFAAKSQNGPAAKNVIERFADILRNIKIEYVPE